MTEPEQWMKDAASLAGDCLREGDRAGHDRVMNKAYERCDREAAELRKTRRKDQ